MKAVKTIVLVLLAIVFIVYGMAFMMYRGVTSTLVDQTYYRSVVSDYQIPGLVHEQLSEMIPEIVRDGITGGATISDPMMKAAVDAQVDLISKSMIDAFDEPWIAEQAVIVTDDVVNVLSAKENTELTAIIDLTPKLAEIEANIAEGLQSYSDAQLMGMFNAPKAFISMIAQQIVAQLGLPERLVISDLVDENVPGAIPMVKSYLSTMNTYLSVLMLIIVALVFFVVCFLFFKFPCAYIWFGISAALSGGLFLIVKGYFSNLRTIGTVSGMDFEALPVPSSTIEQIISFTFSKMNLFPVVFLIVGVVLVVLGIILPKREKEEM